MAFAPVTIIVIGLIVFVGGLVKGTAGFGYALTGTAILASLLDPATAVTIMILPMLIANITLLGELDRQGFIACLSRFWIYLLAGIIGTLAGMQLLLSIPRSLMALGLGVLTVGYVAGTQPYVDVPGQAWLAERCFRPGIGAKAGLGLVSGIVFGATNIAVQVVAYLDTLELDRSTFVGVLAMILVGVSGVRVAAAWWLGLYTSVEMLVVSMVAVVPGLIGVGVGRRVRDVLPARHQTLASYGLLAVIGLRLTMTGIAGL